ncbi:hypothetical protein GCM10011514_18930 [Emticicia aquatilis]|uniref:Uncharacterized protein n=1 Tax=Emticicia aquatilis TaxID=1537369 RepID=A0A916YQU7_9BACT|nr:hypothetical protein [Emticicia aquatilis]GGD54966.1 hypothetical protein GCM10011514_18930 [Emticicia aquatilis]
MKKIILTLIFSLWGLWSYSQSFTAEIGTLFLSDDPLLQYGNIKVLTGIIKKNDKLEIYAPTGRKFTGTIVKIQGDNRQEVNAVKAGEYGFFDVKFTEDPSKGKDYLIAGYKAYPAGFQVNTGAMKAETDAKLSASVNFKTTLDGKSFRGKGTYKGASLWRKGVKNYIDKPYLQLQFGSVDSPDDRTLTIQIFNPKESPAKYSPKDMEINFSGAADGNKNNTTIYGFVNGKADTDFTVEISKWQTSGNKAIISGKVYGELREIKILGRASKTNKFENGSFENIEVEIFNDQADLKEVMKAAGGGGLLKN